MADQELKYKISTEANVSGANAAAEAIGKVDRATQATGQSAGAAGKSLNQTGEQAEKLRAGAQVVGQVLSGNLRALAQFPAVLKAIGTAVVANPLFALGTVLGLVIVPALEKMKAGWDAAGKAASEAGKKNAEAAEAARQAISTQRQNALAERLREIEQAAEGARRKIDELANAEIALTDAQEAEDLAAIDADKSLSEVDRLKKKGATRTAASERRFNVQVGAIEQTAADRRTAIRDTQQAIPQFEDAVEQAEARVREVQSRSPEVIAAERDRLRATIPARAQDRVPEDEQTIRRVSDLGRELETAERDYVQALANAEKTLAEVTAARDAARKKEADLIKQDDDAGDSEAIKLRVLRRQRSSAQRVDELQQPEQLREAAERDKARGESLRAERNVDQLTGARLESPARAAEAEKVVEAARAVPTPAPPDFAPLVAAFGQMGQAIVKSNDKTQADIRALASSVSTLARTVEQQGARVENLANSTR